MAAGSPRPTSRDVAQAAGVSQAAVSLVLGDKWRGRVSERDGGARTGGRAGARLPAEPRRPQSAPGPHPYGPAGGPRPDTEFFAGVYTGAARVAAEHGFGVVLYPSPEGIGPARDPFASAQAALDGVIASSMAADALTAIRGDQLPLVMLDSDPGGQHGRGNGQPRHRATACGRSRNTCWASATAVSCTWRRTSRPGPSTYAPANWPSALAAVPGTALRTGPRARSPSRAPWRPPRPPWRPRAPAPPPLVCDDDKLAAGAYKAARRLGLRVPDDISVTGLDDLALATALDPELTTVRLDAELFGERGMGPSWPSWTAASHRRGHARRSWSSAAPQRPPPPRPTATDAPAARRPARTRRATGTRATRAGARRTTARCHPACDWPGHAGLAEVADVTPRPPGPRTSAAWTPRPPPADATELTARRSA